jgi:sortase A
MKQSTKMIVTIILILMILTPLGYFLIYPNYNKLIGPIKRFNIQRSAEEITFQIITELVPTKDEVLGVAIQSSGGQSIEESLNPQTVLDRKILEELNTKIIINSIDVEGLVYEGADAHTMNKGFWHFPPSSFPGQKGNMVVIGHRYAKLPPNKDTFFNLDKVKVGDKIEVIQNNNQFTYIVTETKVVEKNDISVLQDYSDYRITLITCSPLWTSKQRLVIVGKLDKLYKNT